MLRNHSHFPLEQCRATSYITFFMIQCLRESTYRLKNLDWIFTIDNSITSQIRPIKLQETSILPNQVTDSKHCQHNSPTPVHPGLCTKSTKQLQQPTLRVTKNTNLMESLITQYRVNQGNWPIDGNWLLKITGFRFSDFLFWRERNK